MKTRIIKDICNNIEVSTICVDFKNGFKVELLSLGATLDKIFIDDKIMNLTPNSILEHFDNGGKFGKTIGRYAGRIEDGKFVLNGIDYQLDLNSGTNSAHGGRNGIGEKNFCYEITEDDDYVIVDFRLFDKENFFPGDIDFKISYRISKDLEIEIEYSAVSNKDTILNLTNHTYFNLSGNLSKTILDERLRVKASKFTVMKDNMCPLEIADVNKVMDFRSSKRIGLDIEDEFLQNHPTKGYDHCFILDEHTYNDNIVTLSDDNGIVLDIYTTYPCVVIYSANYPDNVNVYPNKKPIKYDGICFECQYMSNDINYSNKTILKANERYFEKTKFKFRRMI